VLPLLIDGESVLIDGHAVRRLLQAALRAALREDLSCFAQKVFGTLEPGTSYRHNWHIDHIAWQLSRVARGEVRRLIINVPRSR
jgi:hypothetical protein